MNRRDFLKGMALSAGAATLVPGCRLFGDSRVSKVAVQLYSIRDYINGRRGRNGHPGQPGVGIEQALKDIKRLGYEGVEFAGYYGKDAKTLKAMLDDNGLVACGTHVGRGDFSPNRIKATCEFNLACGNKFICCPGGGNFPGRNDKVDDFMKMLVEYYNKAAETAATYGCLIGLHNHQNEFKIKLSDGTTYWDYFFSNTDKRVQMEQDVGWTKTAGCDPCKQYLKYPHRSYTLHAKENNASGVGYESILGQPGKGAEAVPWDELFKVTDADGVKWYVVECEAYSDRLRPIEESIKFLRSKGRV